MKNPILLRERLITVSFITLFAIFLPLWSAPADRFIAGGDGILPELSPHIWLNRLATLWGYYAGTGTDIAFANGWLPVVLIDELLSKLGASPLALNHFWLLLFFVMQALGVCFLYRTIFPEHGPVVSSVFAGLASILNPFVLITFHSPYLPSALSIALFPWLLGLFRRYARSGSPILLAWFTLGCLFDVVADVNIAFITLQFAMLAAVLIFLLVEKGLPGMRQRAIALSAVFICAHAPVLWGISENLRAQMAEIERSMHEYSVGTVSFVADKSKLWNVCRLIGTVLFFGKVGGKPFLIDNQAYVRDPSVIAASCILPLLVASALFIRSGRRRVVALLVGIAVLAVIAANGGAAPFGALSSWALVHVPGFLAFREPFSKFGWIIVLTYALVAAWVIDQAARAERFVRVSVIAVALASLAISAFPMFAKHLFWDQMKVNIPPAYQKMARVLNAAGGDGRILQSPVSPTLFETYTWGYVGSGIPTNLIARPIANRAVAFESIATENLLAPLAHLGGDIGVVEAQRVLAFLNFSQVVDDASFLGGYFQSTEVLHIGPGQSKLFAPRETIDQLTSYDVRAEPTKLVYAARYAVTGVASYDDLGMACRLITCSRTAFLQKPVDGLTATSFETAEAAFATPAWFSRRAGRIVAFRADNDSLTTGASAARRAVAIKLRKDPAVAGLWSAPIEAPLLSRKSAIVADRVSPDVHFVRLEQRAAIHSRIANIRPGARYKLSFAVSDSVDRSALVLVTDERHKTITEAQVADWVQGNIVQFPFRNPSGNHLCYLYLYLPKAGASPVDMTVSRAEIERDEQAVAGLWSAPIENPSLGGKALITADRVSPDVHIVRLEKRADIHSRIENVRSGARYKIIFAVSDGVDRTALVLVTDERLRTITEAQVADRVQGNIVQFPFRNPSGNHLCYLYLYLPKAGASPVDMTVSRAEISRYDLGKVAAMQRPVTLATPRTLVYARRSSGYDIEVTGAPATYLIAFNVTDNPNWVLVGPPGVTATKLSANLYEQAWLVRGAGTYSLQIVYRPDIQRPFVIVTSCLGLLFALVVATYSRPRQGLRRGRVFFQSREGVSGE